MAPVSRPAAPERNTLNVKFVRPARQGRRVLRAVVGSVVVSGVLVATGCGVFESAVERPTSVLQSVRVNLDGQGNATAVSGSAVYLDESTGDSRGDESTYEPGEVVDDLPVRTTAQYVADGKSGDNLDDLAGFTGRVEITITLENLTVAPEQVEYDVAGQARSASALIGAPLSIAASTALPSVGPGAVVLETGEQADGTNAVVSAAEGGGSVLQWATILAPPQTPATATFRLVADVKDFVVPVVDISVQAGFHSDLSFDGAVRSAFAASPDSELGVQQQAISLIADVNEVLTRAGGTITEVRTNLNTTSDTLGIRAVQQLEASSTSLTDQMHSVGEQLTSMQASLEGAATGTQSAMSGQLAQMVSGMNAMLGTTSGTPQSSLDGEGCAAGVVVTDAAGTLYSTFLHLSSLLNGYADANEGCRDQIASEIDTLLGPADPTPETCTVTSMTCSLFVAQTTVADAMATLIADSEAAIANLSPTAIDNALTVHTDLGDTLTTIDTLIAGIGTTAAGSPQWAQLDATINAARDQSAQLAALHAEAQTALTDLTGPGSIAEQQQDLAVMICGLESQIGEEAANEIRAQIDNTRCDGALQLPTDLLATGTLSSRLDGQVEAWTAVSHATAPDATALAQLDSALNALATDVTALHTLTAADASAADALRTQLISSSDAAAQQQTQLGTLLTTARDHQIDIADTLTDTLRTSTSSITEAVAQDIDDQISSVTTEFGAAREALISSYTTTISGLRDTSSHVLTTGKTQIDTQKANLDAAKAEATAALNEQTVAALEHIAQGTAASTRSVTAASLMLTDSLTRVLLDLGDPKAEGSGILGAMSKSAAQSDTADYQLALASQHASGFANLRASDIEAISLRHAQFRASLESTTRLPAFHLDVPAGASSQTIYSFHLGGGA
jgi:hypothetical protein